MTWCLLASRRLAGVNSPGKTSLLFSGIKSITRLWVAFSVVFSFVF